MKALHPSFKKQQVPTSFKYGLYIFPTYLYVLQQEVQKHNLSFTVINRLTDQNKCSFIGR